MAPHALASTRSVRSALPATPAAATIAAAGSATLGQLCPRRNTRLQGDPALARLFGSRSGDNDDRRRVAAAERSTTRGAAVMDEDRPGLSGRESQGMLIEVIRPRPLRCRRKRGRPVHKAHQPVWGAHLRMAATSRTMFPDQFARGEKIENARAKSFIIPRSPTLSMSQVSRKERIEISLTIWVSTAASPAGSQLYSMSYAGCGSLKPGDAVGS